MQTLIHRAKDRGHADFGWLNSHHSFSFGNYYDPEKIHFGALRVLNDDVVSGGMGFGTHPHDNMEIVSIPLEGDLEHKDSTGTQAVIRQNDVQIMSAGTGIQHSEKNHSNDNQVKFLQIWVIPSKRNIKPRYDQKAFKPEDRQDKLQIVVSPNDSEAVFINQDAWFSLGNFSKGFSKDYKINKKGNGVYAFVLEGDVVIGGQLKEDFREPFKERSLSDQMRRKIIENVKITPTEVKAFFEAIPKDSLPFYESELEVSEILVYPKANRDVESYVTRELNDFKREVEAGTKKFEQLATQYSDDPAVKENGGLYKLNRNDKFWDPTFLAAAFKLREGQISPVIKSKFGLHIIQMVSRAGDDAVIRHILKIPPVTDAEIKEAITNLDSVRSKIVAGTLDFGAAVNKYSEDDQSKYNGGQKQGRDGSTYVTIDQLDKDMVVALQNLKVGEVSMPIVSQDERARKTVRLFYLKTRTSPHRENLKEDYNRISTQALEEKRNDQLEKWFRSHIPNYYISIDNQFTTCSDIKLWINNAVVSQ